MVRLQSTRDCAGNVWAASISVHSVPPEDCLFWENGSTCDQVLQLQNYAAGNTERQLRFRDHAGRCFGKFVVVVAVAQGPTVSIAKEESGTCKRCPVDVLDKYYGARNPVWN